MDREDLELLYDEHAQAAYAFALRLSGNPHAAEDLLQNVFCSLAQKPLPPVLNPRSFLLRCLYRAWVDSVRRKQTELRVLTQLAQEPLLPPDDGPVEQAECVGQLLQAIGDLPEEQRLVLHLKIWNFQQHRRQPVSVRHRKTPASGAPSTQLLI
jgi:RNA polymerase sigma-70 factor (ECF subfamily)